MISLNQWAIRHRIPPSALRDLVQMLGVSEPPVARDADASPEAKVQQDIRLAAPKHGLRLWRNNNGACVDEKTGRLIRYGLANDSKKVNASIKSSDLIGITPVQVTTSDVGTVLGVFTSIEVKRSHWMYKGTDREKAQLKWLKLVISLGGLAKFATSAEDLL